MLDFAALPPEVNSGRMYAGAGSSPMVAAAQSWDALAAGLDSAAASCQEVVTELTSGPWVGVSSASMAAAVTPYVAWMDTTAAQAHQTASQLRAAIAAYETAFAATVPPAEIEVNRALSASLVATNILGQNTPMITALEGQYAEMWAQDAAAMYGYTGASAAAATLTPFTSPNQNTNPAGTADQTAAVAQATASAANTAGQTSLSSPGSSVPPGLSSSSPMTSMNGWLNDPLNQAIQNFLTPLGNNLTTLSAFTFVSTGVVSFFTLIFSQALVPAAAGGLPALAGGGLGSALMGSYGSGLGGSAAAGLGNAGVSAALAQAAPVGGLSVPPSWATASSDIQLAAKASPIPGIDGLSKAELAGPGGFYGGVPPMGPVGSVVNAPRDGQTRSRSGQRRKAVSVLAKEPGIRDDRRDRQVRANRNAPDRDGGLSERDELEQLRKAVRDVAKQRDVLTRTAAVLIQEAKHK